MTIQEALDRVDEMKPNMMSRPLKIKYLEELDGLIHREIRLKHCHTEEEHAAPAYSEDTDPGTELIVPTPYDSVYMFWLMAKIDLQNLEIDKYNNDWQLFSNAYDTMSDWWTRTRMPLSRVREFRL